MKIISLLRKCRTLSRQLSRSSSYSSLSRSRSNRGCETIYVGSSRRRYVVRSEYLEHPLLNALIEKSKQTASASAGADMDREVNCEVVLFDHLLWMLENGEPDFGSGSLEELAELYVY